MSRTREPSPGSSMLTRTHMPTASRAVLVTCGVCCAGGARRAGVRACVRRARACGRVCVCACGRGRAPSESGQLRGLRICSAARAQRPVEVARGRRLRGSAPAPVSHVDERGSAACRRRHVCEEGPVGRHRVPAPPVDEAGAVGVVRHVAAGAGLRAARTHARRAYVCACMPPGVPGAALPRAR
jgi:hypothetical protein